jgi:hypothetical protein
MDNVRFGISAIRFCIARWHDSVEPEYECGNGPTGKAEDLSARSPIQFDLLSNARDSLRRAVELMAWDDLNSDHAKLKHAITNAAHAIELLLKERLRREHPAFIWQNVDKYRSLQAQTVTAETAVSRLTTICNLTFTDSDKATLLAIRTTRNAIEHYEWHASEVEAQVIVGNALSFALGFAEEHLGIDLSADFKRDDTWTMLIQQAYEFAKAHSARIATKAPNVFLMRCDECETEMVTDMGSCLLCGHWQETEI